MMLIAEFSNYVSGLLWKICNVELPSAEWRGSSAPWKPYKQSHELNIGEWMKEMNNREQNTDRQSTTKTLEDNPNQKDTESQKSIEDCLTQVRSFKVKSAGDI